VNFEEARRIYANAGPFATVYLDAQSEVTQAAQRLDREWKNVRRELEREGADAGTLAVLDDVVSEGHRGGDTVAAVATGGALVHVERLPDPPRKSIGRWAELPALGPLFEWAQSFVPHVIALADREGADILAVTGNDAAIDAQVSPDNEARRYEREHVHRGKPGGWSQRRFQQRAENTWEKNAGDVADSVTTLAEQFDAGLVVVAGDVRAVQFMEEALPSRVKSMTRVLDHGQRAQGISVDDIAEDVVKQVATVVAEKTVDLLREFRQEHGQHDAAVDGPTATIEALSRAQVRTLLLHDDPDDDRTAWFGPDPAHVAMDRQTLLDMGADDPKEARLVDVALRGAVCTDAEVRIVPSAGGPTGGIGAILRHTGTSP